MFVLSYIKRTTWAAVSQFEGETEDGCPVFVHFKYGWLRLWVGAPGSKIQDMPSGSPSIELEHGDNHDFDVTWSEIADLTGLRVTGSVHDPYDARLQP